MSQNESDDDSQGSNRGDRSRVRGSGGGQEIAVVGSPEFTTGFRLAGVRRFENVPDEEKAQALDEAITNVLEDEGIGIVIMHDDDVDYLDRTVREAVETSVEPVVVTIGGGTGGGGLRDQIKRAIGIDLMEDSESDD